MRRWELVDDGSAKFWEAAVEGASVCVRYGRIGSEGRLQVKELASADAARAHFDKLVAEKLRKGYAEVGGAAEAEPEAIATAEALTTASAESEPAALPDEDTFVLPAAWRRLVHPRRGRAAREVSPRTDADDWVKERMAAERDWIEEILTSPRSDRTLADAARAFLAGSASPLGAGVMAAVLLVRGDTPYADYWVAQHGLLFAARAVVETCDVHAQFWPTGRSRANPELQVLGQRAGFPPRIALVERVRELIAAADESTYQEIVAALAPCRTTPRRRVITAYLAPDTPGWVDECIADAPGYDGDGPSLRLLLLRSLSDPGQVDRLGQADLRLIWNAWSPALIATLADSVGPACVPFLDQAIEQTHSLDQLRTVLSALLELPTDDAFRALLARLDEKNVQPVLKEAMRRYPVRATRLLAEAALQGGKHGAAARQLLTTHVMLHQSVLPGILPRLDAPAAELVLALESARKRVAEASPEALPALLVSPPWSRKRAPRKPRVLDGLRPDDTAQLLWHDGEQEQWATTGDDSWSYPEPDDWAKSALRALRPDCALWSASRFLTQGPAEVLVPFVEQWRPEELWGGPEYLRPVVAKYGVSALPMAVAVVRAKPAHFAPLLLPLLDAHAARVMADGLVRLKSVQPTARSWFARHGIPAGLLLVPDAVGAAGAPRRAAEQALRLVAADQGAAAVLAAVTARYGEEAAEILAETLATDPLEAALPARMPALPVWVQPAGLPQLLLASGEALPEDAARHVVTMLALSKPADPYPGLAVAIEACRADSLARFGWALFEEWRLAGMPAKESWILQSLGILGDDETVRHLTPLLRDWPGEGAHHRAVEGLNVLAAIGSDVALLHLHGIAQRVKFKALKVRAQEKIAEIADSLGLTGEQLADRLVPDFGLATDGTTVIDYGPRRFTVGFDEQLRPFVLDADGKRRKDLPAPGARDDQELAPAERKRFMGLKKDVRTISGDQIRRLEAAMVAQRGWTATEFRELFVRHPLVWHLVRRLVWLAADADGSTVTAFRVAEDRTFADVNDDEFTLAEDATVRLAHPLPLGADLAAWSELFADYEILQPFQQLGRAIHRFTPEEATARRLHRFEGHTVPVGKLLGLTKRGWERGEPQDAGVERWFSKRLGEDCYLVIGLDEGIAVGALDVFPDQTFEKVWLDREPWDHHWRSEEYSRTFGDLDPVVASELLADLEAVTAK